MSKLIFSSIAVLFAFAGAALSQTVTESWLRLSASACGAGLSLEASGDLEALLFRRLTAIGGGVETEFNLTDLERLLTQFNAEDRQAEAENYRSCLLQLMDIAVAGSSLPPREVVLDSPISLAPLDVVQRGQRFFMQTGDTYAIRDLSLIFTINSIGNDGRAFIYFTASNSNEGTAQTNIYRYQGDLIELDTDCVLVPYQIDAEAGQVSLLSNC